MSSTKAKLEPEKCKGPVARKWEELAATAAATADKRYRWPHSSTLRRSSVVLNVRCLCGLKTDGMQNVVQKELRKEAPVMEACGGNYAS